MEGREREASWEETEWEVRGKEREREFDGENKRQNRERNRRERHDYGCVTVLTLDMTHRPNTPKQIKKKKKSNK